MDLGPGAARVSGHGSRMLQAFSMGRMIVPGPRLFLPTPNQARRAEERIASERGAKGKWREAHKAEIAASQKRYRERLRAERDAAGRFAPRHRGPR